MQPKRVGYPVSCQTRVFLNPIPLYYRTSSAVSIPCSSPSPSIPRENNSIYFEIAKVPGQESIYSQLSTLWQTKARTESSSKTTTTPQPLPSRAKAAISPPQETLPPRNPPVVPSPVLLSPPFPTPFPHPRLTPLSRLRLRAPLFRRLYGLEDGIRHVTRRQAAWEGTIRHRKSGRRACGTVGGRLYEVRGSVWGGCWGGCGQYGA